MANIALQEKDYTADDLWEISHLPENDGKRIYLIEGALYEMPPTSWLHGDVAMEVGRQISNHVKGQKLGRVTAAETGFNLAPGTSLAPDVGFIAAERVPKELPPKGYVPFAPDLAVEVVSPGNDAEEISAKIQKYLQYGTRMVWIIYPNQRRVEVYRPAEEQTATVTFVEADGVVDGGDVLPGFHLKLSDIFPD
ncbi:MAG: Uma2 family endonuclease [Chloroflexi bacterium]|nr:Uma2 family endonuclease [Chloroflexota bacterium]